MHTASPAEETPALDQKHTRQGILFKTHTGDPHLDKHLEYIRKVSWASTSLGPLESWPQELLQLCHVSMLDPQPRLLILGSERVLFYNGPYAKMCGDKHPDILGQPIIEAWGDVAAYAVDVPLATAEATGRGVDLYDQSLVYERNGFLEEVFLSWTVIPLLGSTPGFYVTLTDVTETNLAEKRRAVLRALNAAWDVVKEPHEFWQSILRVSALNPSLFPFAFLYAAEPSADSESSIDTSPDPTHEMRFKLAGSTGDTTITARLPEELRPDHFALLSKSTDPTLVRQNEATRPIWPCLAQDCILVPIHSNRSEKIIAYLFLGTNPKRPYNENYQEWMHEFSRCLNNAATNVLLAEEEKRKQHYRAIQVAREQQRLATALANRDREALAVTDQYQRTLKVVDMANVGIFEYDLEGRLIYANDAYKAMAHCPSEMMHADKLVFLDLTFPEDAEYLMSKWGCAARGSPCTFEVRFKTPEGQGIWVLAAVIPVFENGVVTSVSGCTTNIHDTKLRETESVQRLQALERAKAWERRFANFAEMAPIAIYFGSQRHHQFSYCNRAWFEMTGHPVVPFDQIDWASIVYEEDIELVRSSWTRVFSTQNHTTVQYRLRRSWADGNGVTIGPVWVTASALPEYNEDGSIKGIIGTMLDISALKFAETVQQMKVQEALEAKRQSSNFIDMTSHEIRNPLGAVFHCSDATQETLADMTVLANKLASTTESKIGEQLRELIANGVDSVSTIISCSQHQKRIVDDILVLSKLDSNLLQISPSSVRVTTLLRDVEKMFEAEAQRSDVQLETQAHASLEQMEVNWVLLDPGRVQQVLINLLTNAIKFCKKKNQRKVTIRIGASKIRPSENVLPNIDFVVAHSLHDSVYDDPKFESQSFYLWFSVEDTGRGMSADEKSRIFARFTQGSPRTESEYGGSGLGLFISRELAELQGGEIGVASELHVGSTFAFFVKTRHTEAPVTKTLHKNLTLQQKEQQTQATKKSDINILVVEDNAVNQKLLRQQLSKHGFTVTTADNGVDCLSQLQKTKHWRANSATSAPSVEVILMDIEMPLMDGLQATREIRKLEKEGKLTGHVPIIAVSANARQEQRDLAMDAGMDDSISKPFRIAELVPKIERLAGWT
ncbi:putative histidine kinase HHK19p, partial [Aureobasidium melanogenum]